MCSVGTSLGDRPASAIHFNIPLCKIRKLGLINLGICWIASLSGGGSGLGKTKPLGGCEGGSDGIATRVTGADQLM